MSFSGRYSGCGGATPGHPSALVGFWVHPPQGFDACPTTYRPEPRRPAVPRPRPAFHGRRRARTRCWGNFRGAAGPPGRPSGLEIDGAGRTAGSATPCRQRVGSPAARNHSEPPTAGCPRRFLVPANESATERHAQNPEIHAEPDVLPETRRAAAAGVFLRKPLDRLCGAGVASLERGFRPRQHPFFG